MKKLLILSLTLVPVAVLATSQTPAPPISKWADGFEWQDANVGPNPAMNRQYTTVRVDTSVFYVRFLFEPEPAVVIPTGEDPWLFFAYNDFNGHIRTKAFQESQFSDPISWISVDAFTESDDYPTLRYICPHYYYDGGLYYPQMTSNGGAPYWNLYMIDEGGVGTNIWSLPYDVTTDVTNYYLPITATTSTNMVHMDGQGRDVDGDSHHYVNFDGWTGEVGEDVMIFPSDPQYGDNYVYAQGFENSNLLYDEAAGRLVIATGAYMDSLTADPAPPLLVVYRESNDEGATWSDNVWLDQTNVPDMPGDSPGINTDFSNSFADGVIDALGNLHFIMVISDPGSYTPPEREIFGMYDVHEVDGSWTATMISDGIYQIGPDSVWNPRTEMALFRPDWIDGDSFMGGPSLSVAPDGRICAAWHDWGWVDYADTVASLEIWFSYSDDLGTTWSEPVAVTQTGPGDTDYDFYDESFPKLLACTTDQYAYVATTYGGYWVSSPDDSPMDVIQIELPPSSADVPKPHVASLSAVVPNPFRDEASVSLSLASPAKVEAKVYNVNGELVQTIQNGHLEVGDHQLVFDGREAPAGIYFCQVNAGGQTMSRKMILVK
jgi:hypothetical protein